MVGAALLKRSDVDVADRDRSNGVNGRDVRRRRVLSVDVVDCRRRPRWGPLSPESPGVGRSCVRAGPAGASRAGTARAGTARTGAGAARSIGFGRTRVDQATRASVRGRTGATQSSREHERRKPHRPGVHTFLLSPTGAAPLTFPYSPMRRPRSTCRHPRAFRWPSGARLAQ